MVSVASAAVLSELLVVMAALSFVLLALAVMLYWHLLVEAVEPVRLSLVLVAVLS